MSSLHSVFLHRITAWPRRYLSRHVALHDPLQNIGDAIQRVIAVRKVLEHKRGIVDKEFHRVFLCTSKLAENMDKKLIDPRIVGRQSHRANAPADGPGKYWFYRKNIFIPGLIDRPAEDTVRGLWSKRNVTICVQEFMPLAINATPLCRTMEAADLS